jgi:hypothetical protein
MLNPHIGAAFLPPEAEAYAEHPYRDSLFRSILESFNGKPINVFQVGAIESLETEFRIGSGWSELFWGEYINKNGGSLHVCDINMNHIAHSNFAASKLGYKANFYINDATACLKELFVDRHDFPPFDIYYLDGADEPLGNQQTLDQFKIIEKHKALVLVDDVPTKGQLILEYLDNHSIVKHYELGNGMMTIDLRGETQREKTLLCSNKTSIKETI